MKMVQRSSSVTAAVLLLALSLLAQAAAAEALDREEDESLTGIPGEDPLPENAPVRECGLLPDPGTCLEAVQRYYYQPHSNSCVAFVYSGCGGNSNNFLDRDSCGRICGSPRQSGEILPVAAQNAESTESKTQESDSEQIIPETTTEGIPFPPQTTSSEDSHGFQTSTSSSPTPTTETPSSSPESTTQTIQLVDESTSEQPRVSTQEPFVIADQYNAVLTENTVVPLMFIPPFKVPRKVCEIEINNDEEPAFRFELNYGLEEMVVYPIRQFNCEEKKAYHFEITLTDCGTPRVSSNTAQVYVIVNDENEFAPEFSHPSFNFTLTSGSKFEEVIKVKDQDCGRTFSSICSYDLIPVGHTRRKIQKFSQDDGVLLKSRKDLLYPQDQLVVMDLVATDCGGKSSPPTRVTINVLEPCEVAWTGIEDVEMKVDQPTCLLPNVQFNPCRMDCKDISLTFDLESCRKEAIMETVDRCEKDRGINVLVPVSGYIGHEVLEFDGVSNEMIVQAPEIDLPEKFSFSIWMKHDFNSSTEQKQTLICEGDQFSKNRRHFHLFIHQCNIGLTWRKPESSSNGSSVESYFHWADTGICKGEWNHVVLNVNGHDDVRLTIDGVARRITSQRKDGPLLDIDDSHQVSWSVGACWQPKQQTFTQFYAGKLASIRYLPNEQVEVGKGCEQRCTEYLTYMPDEHSRHGTSSDSHGSWGESMGDTFGVEARDPAELTHMAASVHYYSEPTSTGRDVTHRRRVAVTASALCGDWGGDAGDRLFQTFLTLHINARTHEAADNLTLYMRVTNFAFSSQALLSSGVEPLRRLSFVMSPAEKAATVVTGCSFRVSPPLSLDRRQEGLVLMAESPQVSPMTADPGGLYLQGRSSAAVYERLLFSILYFSKADLPLRNGTVQCMGESGLMSNEISLSLNCFDSYNQVSCGAAAPGGIVGQDYQPSQASRFMDNTFDPLLPFQGVPDTGMQRAAGSQHQQLAALKKARFSSHPEVDQQDVIYVYGLCVVTLISFVAIISFAAYRAKRADSRVRGEVARALAEETAHPHALLTITENPTQTLFNPGFLSTPGEARVKAFRRAEKMGERRVEREDEEEAFDDIPGLYFEEEEFQHSVIYSAEQKDESSC